MRWDGARGGTVPPTFGASVSTRHIDRGREMGQSAATQARRSSKTSAQMVRHDVLRFRDDTFRTRNWGHKGLRAALRELSVEEASWTPGHGVHSVWEQINHVAHWKRYVLERIRGRSRRVNQAWPPAGRSAADLRRAIAALDRLHRDLQHVVGGLSREALEAGVRRYSTAQLLLGEAAHDAYHTGQILLTRKLYRRHRRVVSSGLPTSLSNYTSRQP